MYEKPVIVCHTIVELVLSIIGEGMIDLLKTPLDLTMGVTLDDE
jgi:hypothetical protein